MLSNTISLRNLACRILTATLATAVTGTLPAQADQIELLIAYEDIPGAEQLVSGDFRRGISITQEELAGGHATYRSRLLTNLCGAYVETRSISKARHTCEKAVLADASPAAHNNRGVLRTLTGDFDGARQDFSRSRPQDFDAYLEELKKKDARYMADENLALLDEVEARIASIDEAGEPERLSLDIPIEKL